MTMFNAKARRSSTTALAATTILLAITTVLIADVALTNQVKLIPVSPGPFTGEGFAVSISGTTAVAGAPFGAPGIDQGTAHVYVFNGVTWQFEASLFPNDPVQFDQFGTSAAISGDTILIGAPFAASTFGNGAVYVFERTAGIWNQTARLEAPVDFGGQTGFGGAVALDGDTAAVGDWGGALDTGHVLVYSRMGGVWDTQNPFTIDQILPDPGSSFGSSLDIQGDILVAGAPDQETGPFTHHGIVEIFKRNGAAWDDFGLLNLGQIGSGDEFGKSVAIDGDHVIVGAPFRDGGKGATFVFHRNAQGFWTTNATDFTQLPHKDPQADENFGFSVAKSGGQVLVGAFGRDASTGAAYTYDDLTGTSFGTTNVAVNGPADIQFGWSVALDNARAIVGANVEPPGGQAYAYDVAKHYNFPRFNWTFILWPYKYIYMGCPIELQANTAATIKMDLGRHHLTPSIATAPRNGALRFVSANTIEYRPDRGFSGHDTFTVRLTDRAGVTLDKTADVTVIPLVRGR